MAPVGCRLSRELQIGKAAEHLVCADLILQGHCAFLADQGLPYDVVVDTSGKLVRVQVRSSGKARTIQGREKIYAYGTRRAKGAGRATRADESDWYAFVALDIRKVAYLSDSELIGWNPVSIVQTVHFRSAADDGKHNGFTRGATRAMRVIEDYAKFDVRPGPKLFEDSHGSGNGD